MTPAPDPSALLAHASWVRFLAAALVRDGAAAEDLAQEALLAAWQRPPRDPSALRSYLRSVVSNLLRRGARDADRRLARERRSARSEALPSAAETAERLATHRELVAAVDALPEPYRTAILLRHFEDLPPRTIAARLGVPVKTVQTRLTRGHALLRDRLDANHGGDRRSWAALVVHFLGEPIDRRPAAPRTSLARQASIAAAATGALVLLGIAVRASRGHVVRESSAARAAPPAVASPLSSPLAGSERSVAAGLLARTRLRGHVRSRAGDAIAEAELRAAFRPSDGMVPFGAFGRAEEVLGTAVSGSDGSFEIEVPAGRILNVRARARGFGVARRHSVDPESELEIVLEPAATLAIVALGEDGGPVEGARVRLFGRVEPESAFGLLVEGSTDALGRWKSAEVPPAVFRLEVDSPRRPMLRLPNVVVRSGDSVERELRLRAGVRVAGSVREAKTGAAVRGAEVRIEREGEARATTDDAGRFEVDGLDPEGPEVRLTGAAAGYASAEARVDPHSSSGAVELELHHGSAVSGRLRGAGGEAIAGAWVAAFGHVARAIATPLDWIETRSDASGAFDLNGLRSDLPHALFVRTPGLATIVRELPSRGEGERIDLGDLEVAAGATLEGIVLRDDGTPAAGAVVHVVRANLGGSPVRETSTVIRRGGSEAEEVPAGPLDLDPLLGRDAFAGDDGRFRVPDLAPAEYRATARIGLLRSGPVDVELGEGELSREVRLTIPRGLSIEGRVVDEEDRPLAGAWVLLFGKDGRLEERSEETGVEGRFRMEGLEGIEYRLTAGRLPSGPDTESFARAEVGGLVPPRLDVVVRLTRATSVEGRVIDAAGRPLARAVVDARDAEGRDYQALSDGEGRFRLQVAAGAVLQIEGAWPGPGADAGDGRRRTGKLAEIAAGSRGNVLTLD